MFQYDNYLIYKKISIKSSNTISWAVLSFPIEIGIFCLEYHDQKEIFEKICPNSCLLILYHIDISLNDHVL